MKNVGALSAAQAASYVFPLIVLPYTAKVLEPRSFGIVALVQAAVQYSILVTSYGFSFSATRLAAISQSDKHRLAKIAVDVWSAKSLLMVGCLLINVAVFAVHAGLRPALGAYMCGFLMVLGVVLQADWFFQAVEEMKWITVANVVPKLLLTPLIFIVVKAPSDYVWLLLIQSSTFVTSGIVGTVLVLRHLGVRLPRPTLRGAWLQLAEGWHTFLASAAINIYTATNVLLLGLLTNSTVVGYYSAGQKVVAAVQSLWAPVSHSLYPHFCKSFEKNALRTSAHLKKLTTIVGGLTLCGAVVASCLAPHVVPAYLGPRFANSTLVIQILIFNVCVVAVNNVLGIHGMLAAGLHGDFLRVVSTAAAVSLVLSPAGILMFGYIGLAAVSVSIELLICLHEYRLLRRRALL